MLGIWPAGSGGSSQGRLSRNGLWLAYYASETNRNEIYVRTFAGKPSNAGGKWSGGSHPVWGRDGKELFFLGADGKMMSVEVRNASRSSPTKFDFDVPKALFDTHLTGFSGNTRFDVATDGRFLIPVPLAAAGASGVPITMVLNWQAGLKK